MKPDRQSRVIGLALLQGRISFQLLDAARQALLAAEGEADSERLLAELLRRGYLDDTTLLELNQQVEELDQMLPDSDPDPNQNTRPLASLVDPLTTAEGKLEGEGLDLTPTRILWATLPSPERPRADHRHIRAALTLPKWNHYVNLQFVGEGGMGRIFRAFDPALRRKVALKFLNRNDPTMAARLLLEAQHQAQVDHPNICKVYEVREWKGQVYVAMQFIEGTRLDRAARFLELEAKVEILETVARAVHAAHRHGLVHRDLKPANIMLEATEEGPLKPYVVDFGLARDLTAAHETQDGTIMGTVHYMAPEQAKGDLSRIERRTDVYALGVTLYELLAGHPPFVESHGIACLLRIQGEEVPPLRKVVPTLHPDLETIVMKCLEKEVPRRYESARALAEDLRRYLEGEPILARPATLLDRFQKLMKKYKPVAALMGLAAAAVLVFAALGLHARLTAKNQAQWAQHFGQEAERIEALLRYARLQPVHDVRGEMATVQARIGAMREAIQRAGRGALGPGSYALGRAYLAMGDPERARASLNQAWEAGFRAPEAAYARGRALGLLYVQALQQARSIQDRDLRAERLKELEETLRNPAVDLLRQGRGASLEPASFQEGLLALYDRRYTEAVDLARKAAHSAPWFYEARALEAEADLERARKEKDPARALEALESAGASLKAAVATAPSDPRLCDLESRRWWEAMIFRRQAGLGSSEAFGRIQASCDRWDLVDPGSPDGLARRAWAWVEGAQEPGAQEVALRLSRAARGVDLAEGALRQAPEHPEALGALAAGIRIQAYAAMERGQDHRPALDRSIALLRQALGHAPSAFEILDQLATAYWARIELEKTLGRDPTPILEEALKAVGGLAERFPRVADFEGYLGGFYVELADFEADHGKDPGYTTAKAAYHFGLAVAAQPHRYDFHFGLGNAHLTRAQFTLFRKGDPFEELSLAEEAYTRALEKNPKALGTLYGRAEARILRAWALEAQRKSPLGDLALAERDLAEARSLTTPSWRDAYYTAASALVRGRWLRPPDQASKSLEQAEADTRAALADNPLQHHLHWLMALIDVERAHRFPEEARTRLRQARSHLESALKMDPGFDLARLALAELREEEAGSPSGRAGT